MQYSFFISSLKLHLYINVEDETVNIILFLFINLITFAIITSRDNYIRVVIFGLFIRAINLVN